MTSTSTRTPWPTFVKLLGAYAQTYGHTNVPQKFTLEHDGQTVALGRKVNQARTRYAAGRLPEQHIADLEQLPGWSWNAEQAHWETTMTKIERHLGKHGTLRGLPEVARLWLIRQRKAATEGALTAEQAARVTALDQSRTIGRSRVSQFVDAAQLWLQQHPGTDLTDLARGSTIDTPQGRTIDLYRRAIYYRRRKAGLEGTNPLTADEVAQIEQLPGWTW